VLERIVALRAAMKAQGLPVLEVQSKPAGAKVLIDGQAAGRAPVAVDVPAGIHYVLLDDNGRIHTERIVVPAGGARVAAQLGSPEGASAATLTRRLRDPVVKQEFTELAAAVADVTVSCTIAPWGKTEQVVCARVTAGALDAVIGTRLPLRDGPREKALFALVDAAVRRPDDAWVLVDDNVGLIRQEFLQGAGDPDAVVVEESEAPVLAIVGGIAGGVAVVVGAGIGVLLYLDNENKKDTGFTYGVDISGL
ncbi:MAG TPA: PEGA domain-containing protein, partial [Myxococcota bacterium]